eukprot:5505638-Pleurochrysis_carterae.AAC.1
MHAIASARRVRESSGTNTGVEDEHRLNRDGEVNELASESDFAADSAREREQGAQDSKDAQYADQTDY